MALTPSNMMPLGTTAPAFTLPNPLTKTQHSLQELAGIKGTVVMFICNHCPFVLHVEDELIKIANDYQSQGINFIAISANDAEHYPQDGPDKMAERAAEKHYPFPYLFDQTQATAKAYNAACTPDIYCFDANLQCVYRGQLDGARPGNEVPVNGEDLRQALDAVVKGKPVSDTQYPSMGCNIKWKE